MCVCVRVGGFPINSDLTVQQFSGMKKKEKERKGGRRKERCSVTNSSAKDCLDLLRKLLHSRWLLAPEKLFINIS